MEGQVVRSLSERRRYMKKMMILMIALAIVAAPSMAQDITIDYAHDYDFRR